MEKSIYIDSMLDLYPKLAKNAYVYTHPTAKNGHWWQKLSGEYCGKLYSWIENTEGVFLMFYVNDNYTNTKPYFIKLERGLLDWASIDTQIKTKLKKEKYDNAYFYERWYLDFEDKVMSAYDTVATAAKEGAKTSLTLGITALALIALIKFKK